MAIEPPTPSAEQLAEWQALVERVRQGDRSQVVAWDEVAAARTIASYRVLVTQLVHRRLRGAAHGLLTYWVLEPERIVVLLDLTWAG